MTARFRDPRYAQIVILSSLLLYGLIRLDFDIRPWVSGLVILTCLLTQYLATRIWRLPRFEPKSALISALSLCLLLRTQIYWLFPVAAVVTILSKFLLRSNGKHIFNPTNFGLVILLLLSDHVWIASGQWGRDAVLIFAVACSGLWIVYHATRSDVTLAFLGCYAALLFGRAWWLGDPWVLPWHHLQNGALLIFAFFMISDPKTTPDSRPARLLFAACVALGACLIQFVLYQRNGVFWSLACVSCLTPVLDRMLPGTAYQWILIPQRRSNVPNYS